jgi:RND family efflux transporter MFP subunit
MDGINPSDQKSEFEVLDRSKTEVPERDDHTDSTLEEAEKLTQLEKLAQRSLRTQLWRSMLRRFATLAIFLLAVLISLVTWDLYVTSPWTRDGRIRVQVASVAPEISGRIVAVRIADNQFVHKGDVLYQIEPFDFEVALRTNKAVLEQKKADLHVKVLQNERRQKLSDLATTAEEQQVYEGSAIQAKAAVDAAEQQVAEAEINLRRTQVRSPVNGYITNLLMRQGDYAHAGASNVSIVDADSFWVDGYFEETKLARLCIGDRAEAKLMGYAKPIRGHITTVTRGISVSDASPGTQGLPNVDAVYTWVRLAQRVPVRIAIDDVPPGVPLVSGTTATVTVRDSSGIKNQGWFARTKSAVVTSLSDILWGASSPPPDCIPVGN